MSQVGGVAFFLFSHFLLFHITLRIHIDDLFYFDSDYYGGGYRGGGYRGRSPSPYYRRRRYERSRSRSYSPRKYILYLRINLCVLYNMCVITFYCLLQVGINF